MILGVKSPFSIGDGVQVVIPELNFRHGAAELYPHLGTGDIVLPVKEDKKKGGVVDDLDTQRDLEGERFVLVSLDKWFFRKDPETGKIKPVSKLTVPWALLKKIKQF